MNDSVKKTVPWLEGVEDDLGALYADHLAHWQGVVEAALARIEKEHLVVFSGTEAAWFLDDQHHPMRTNPWFRVLTPLSQHAGGWLVMSPGTTPRLFYHQPRDFWHQPPRDPDGYWVGPLDVEITRSPAEAAAALPDPATTVLIGEGAEPFLPEAWRDAANPPELLAALDWHRAVKTGYELALMRAANRRAAPAHVAAELAFRAGASEFAMHLAYLAATQHTEDELPYGSIIATNEGAAVLHYQARRREPVRPSRSLLVDAGATVAGYASDITRTTPAEPGPFADLVDAVEALQLALCDRVRAGIAFPELHREAHAGLGRVLAEAGLVRCSPEAAVEAGITLKFLPHGLGHLIGAQVHDVGGRLAGPDGSETAPPDDFPTLRTTRTLETDMVVTIEPGLYFIPSLLGELRESKAGGEVDWSAVEALVPFGGIRIEDDVRVLAEGHENLTRPAMAAAARTDSP